ncbi:hypothetical protein [Bdellovibrio sp. HCB2-146]|uniref:hypothetical protein n=1 Tax=Bdellovibrio sp. HCB2-146 TaxID=3394362 RepID=UPI0039BD3DF1
MKKTLVLTALALFCSLQVQAQSLKYKFECKGATAEGVQTVFSIDEIGNKDSWDSLTASVFTHHKDQKSLLCEEAWIAGRKGAVIDDGLGLENDLYIECGGERANEVYYRILLNKIAAGSYEGAFHVGEGLAPFGIARFGGSQALTCVKVQK